MRAFIPSETALVLGGGGAKGAYEVGAIAALDALGVKAGSVFGTSVGALHAAMYAQGSMDAAAELWSSIRLSDVVSEESLAIADDAENIFDHPEKLLEFITRYAHQKGVDVSPLMEILHRLIDEDRVRRSGVRLGVVTTRFPSLAMVEKRLEEMEAMGVSCVKLEGRMKRPEYVAVITRIYARLLEEGRGPTADERAELEQAFSRSGFTDWYWQGKHGAAMFGTRPENAPDPKDLFEEARRAYERDSLRTVPVDLSCSVSAGVPCTLTVSDRDGHSVTVTGPVPEAARTRALDGLELEARLRKTGGTAYRCDTVVTAVDDGLSLPASAVNGLRRDALAALTEARTAPPQRRRLPEPPPPEDSFSAPDPVLTVSVARREQLTEDLLSLGPARVYVPLEILAGMDALPDGETEWCAVLPRVWRDRDEDTLRAWLDRARALGVTGALLGNIGHVPLADGCGLDLYGDFGLNVFNSRSLEYLRDKGLQSACVSFELRFSQIRDLAKCLPAEAIVYGRLPLMITEHDLTAGGVTALRDRTGAEFPLLSAFSRRTEIQNSRPLWLADRTDWRKLGLTHARLRFTTETAAECVRVFRAYLTGAAPEGAFTRGLYERGVE